MHVVRLRTFLLFMGGLFSFSFSYVAAQQLTAMRDSIPNSYHFWFYQPEEDKDSAYNKQDSLPLVIFLHGRSLSGNDLQKVRQYGTISAIEKGLTLQAFVAAPQTNKAWDPQKIWLMAQWIAAHYPVDTNRIYLLGMSMGGYGTINTAATFPHYFAAAMALCGGATLQDLCGLNHIPLCIVHGTKDTQVPPSASDKVVHSMTLCGDTSRLIYSKLQGANHSILARTFYLPQTYQWLMAHSLNDSARTNNEPFQLSLQQLNKAYQPLKNKHSHITVINSPHTTLPQTDYSDAPNIHTVKKGDTLYAIAKKYGTSVKQLCLLNHINQNSILSIGMKLRIK